MTAPLSSRLGKYERCNEIVGDICGKKPETSGGIRIGKISTYVIDGSVW